MPQFSPDQVSFNDVPGYGFWDTGHYREHVQFVQVLSAKIPDLVVPDFDFFGFLAATPGQQTASRDMHMRAHNILRQYTAVTGLDLFQVNLQDENEFYNWTGAHATEHAQIRQALGIV